MPVGFYVVMSLVKPVDVLAALGSSTELKSKHVPVVGLKIQLYTRPLEDKLVFFNPVQSNQIIIKSNLSNDQVTSGRAILLVRTIILI